MTRTSSQERPASSVLDGPGGLMEALALGTGFDIALAHYELLPRDPDPGSPQEVQPDAPHPAAADLASGEPTAVVDAAPIFDPAVQAIDCTDTSWLFLAFGG